MTRFLVGLGFLFALVAHPGGGDAGGNGGDVYVDEFKAYRTWLIRILRSEHERFEKDFSLTPMQFTEALSRLEKVHLIRKGCRRIAFIGRVREVRGVTLPEAESLKELAGMQCAFMEDGLHRP